MKIEDHLALLLNPDTPNKERLFAEVADEINSSFSYTQVLKEPTVDNEFLKTAIAVNISPHMLNRLNTQGGFLKAPTFFGAFLLAGASNNDIGDESYMKDLVSILKKIITIPENASELAQSIGFFIGDGLCRGKNMNEFFTLFSNKLSLSTNVLSFLMGMESGFKERSNLGLHRDPGFLSYITTRFNPWTDYSKELSFEMLDLMHEKNYIKEKVKTLNPENEKITWALHMLFDNPQTALIHEQHEALKLSLAIETPKKNNLKNYL